MWYLPDDTHPREARQETPPLDTPLWLCKIDGIPALVYAAPEDQSGGTVSCQAVHFGDPGWDSASTWRSLYQSAQLLLRIGRILVP